MALKSALGQFWGLNQSARWIHRPIHPCCLCFLSNNEQSMGRSFFLICLSAPSSVIITTTYQLSYRCWNGGYTYVTAEMLAGRLVCARNHSLDHLYVYLCAHRTNTIFFPCRSAFEAAAFFLVSSASYRPQPVT